jgi:replication factor A1
VFFFLSTVDKVKPGTTVIFRNARIDMFKDTMRLAVDKWGLIEVIENHVWFEVNKDNNVSEVEYELVNVPPEEVNAPGKREKANMPAEERY